MKKISAFLLIILLSPILAMAQGGVLDKEDEEDKKQPLRVTSERMVSEKKKQLISFYGNVVAVKGKLTVESDEMYVYTNENQSDFREIEALGSVVITRGEKVATGEKANYYADKQQIILVGSPVLTQGKDVASGEKVVYFFDTEDMEIYGGKNKRSTMILFPKDEVKQDIIEQGEPPRAEATFGKAEEKSVPDVKAVDAGEVKEEAPAKETLPPRLHKKVVQVKKIEKKRVKVKKIEKKPEKVVKPAKPKKQSTRKIEPRQEFDPDKPVWYTIQVGSHQNIQESIRLKKKLAKNGYNAYIRLFREQGRDWYRVRVGGFKTKSSALRFSKRLEEKENLPTLLIPYQP